MALWRVCEENRRVREENRHAMACKGFERVCRYAGTFIDDFTVSSGPSFNVNGTMERS